MSDGLGEWDDELEDTAAPTDPAEEDSDAPELFYPNAAELVSGKLATSYRRQLTLKGHHALWVKRLSSFRPPYEPVSSETAPGRLFAALTRRMAQSNARSSSNQVSRTASMPPRQQKSATSN